MDTLTTARDRINNAADALYEETGRQVFPTVDAVRKRAKVNMNDASVGMREWRHAKSVERVEPITQLPASLHQANSAFLNSLWTEAVKLSGEALEAARIGWQAERRELETLGDQLATAFETQALDLSKFESENTKLKENLTGANEALAICQRRLDEVSRDLVVARLATDQVELRLRECDFRATEMRASLDGALAANMVASREHGAMRHTYEVEIANLRDEVTKVRTEALEVENGLRDLLQNASATAAVLRGKLEVVGESSAQRSKSRSFRVNIKKNPEIQITTELRPEKTERPS